MKNPKFTRMIRMGTRARLLAVMCLLALAIPAALVAQSTEVNIGTAGDFVILTKTGVSTTGVTAVTGDIGVSAAAATYITGFGLIMDMSGTYATSSLVTGKLYAADYTAPTPAKMTAAISDMETAFTIAAGRTLPDSIELGSGDITGRTIAPGLYKWGTAVVVGAGGVTLSGSSSDIWVFQIAQDLLLASGAAVTLSGGAQASNIFWQVSGQVSLGTTAAMKGIILCQTQIVFNSGATLEGRALAQTAVTLDANTITAPVFVTSVRQDETPRKFGLSQNFPNPFNPSTVIEYTVERAGPVSLKVYSVLGVEVATLVSGRREAGRYSVPFGRSEGSTGLTSGVYFYRLEAGSQISTRMFTLLK